MVVYFLILSVFALDIVLLHPQMAVYFLILSVFALDIVLLHPQMAVYFLILSVFALDIVLLHPQMAVYFLILSVFALDIVLLHPRKRLFCELFDFVRFFKFFLENSLKKGPGRRFFKRFFAFCLPAPCFCVKLREDRRARRPEVAVRIGPVSSARPPESRFFREESPDSGGAAEGNALPSQDEDQWNRKHVRRRKRLSE